VPSGSDRALLHLGPAFVDGYEVKARLLTLSLLASLALPGCFVFDEIQKGIDIMDSHSAAPTKKQADQAHAESKPEAESKLPEYKAKLAKWWTHALEEEPPAKDPNNGIVRCDLQGKVSFTRKSDCTSRGGRLVSR
jgi:hypothetical protein